MAAQLRGERLSASGGRNRPPREHKEEARGFNSTGSSIRAERIGTTDRLHDRRFYNLARRWERDSEASPFFASDSSGQCVRSALRMPGVMREPNESDSIVGRAPNESLRLLGAMSCGQRGNGLPPARSFGALCEGPFALSEHASDCWGQFAFETTEIDTGGELQE